MESPPEETSKSTIVKKPSSPKITVGDLCQQIERHSSELLKHQNCISGNKTLTHLSFLVLQTRYASDLKVKRKLISKIVDAGALQIFCRIFKYANSQDFLHSAKVDDVQNENISPNNSRAGSANAITYSSGEGQSDLILAESAQTCRGASGSSMKISDEAESKTDKDPQTSVSQSSTKKKKNLNKKKYQSIELQHLLSATILIWNSTDKSLDLCRECLRTGMVPLILTALSHPQLAVSELKKSADSPDVFWDGTEERLFLVKGYMGILHNLLNYVGEAREEIRNAGAVKIIKQYVQSTYLGVKTKAILILSYIINESENDIINASDLNISFIIKVFKDCVESENHFSKRYGYWAYEIASGLTRMSLSESNKQRLLSLGCLPHYVKLLQTTCTADEQLAAIQGIWSCAFVQDNRKIIQDEPGCVEALEQLGKNSSGDDIRMNAKGALWLLKETLPGRPSAGKKESGQAIGHAAGAPAIPSEGHIMISYQWDNQKLMIQIRDALQQAGFTVWMDIEKMSGSVLESMASAVENSSMVLVCMSQKYKDSPNCRLEAEYAQKLRKNVIPLRVQRGYNPDGWLGIIVGTKLYFDFSHQNRYDMLMKNLAEEITRVRKKLGLMDLVNNEAVSGKIESVHVDTVGSIPQASLHVQQRTISSNIVSWQPADVQKWLTDNDLIILGQPFKDMDGSLLKELYRMQHSAPESFYTILRTDLALNCVQILRLSKALYQLAEL